MKELTEVTVFTIRLRMETKVSSGGHEQELPMTARSGLHSELL